jgi:hypothetical protein
MLFRTNMLIFFIGMVILYAVYFGKRNKKLLVFSLVGSFLCFLVFYQGPLLALKSMGYEKYQRPAKYWVAMSLQTENTLPEKYKYLAETNYQVNGRNFPYKDSLNDRVEQKYGKSEVKYKQNWSEFVDDDLKMIATYYAEHPKEMMDHFIDKFKLAWSDPDFHTFVFFDSNNSVNSNLTFLNIEKNLVFLLALLFVVVIRSKIRSYQMLPLIIFLGGFVFHVFLWEVSSRYMVPYFMILLPIAASCMHSVIEKTKLKATAQNSGCK